MGQSRKTLIAVAAVVVVAVIAVLVSGVGQASADEVQFQNVADPGPKPFTAPTDVPKASSSSSADASSSSSSSSTDPSGSGSSTDPSGSGGSTDPSGSGGSTDPSASGGSGEQGKPGAFGGSGKNTVCDREKLIAELTADPEKLSAWAETVGIDADAQAVGEFIRKLKPSTLTQDTQVTNHRYSGGKAEAYQAILPKGTAVLVDDSGKPVARCRCGNPLTEPVELAEQTKCINCPANYQPPPECGDRCSRPEPNPPPVSGGGGKGTTLPPKPGDPIKAAKDALDKCRKDKGSLEQCKTEYEKVRTQCAANPLSTVCDSSVCFDAVTTVDGASSGCSSYLDRGDILGVCLKLEQGAKQACLKNLDDLQKKCAGNASTPDCKVDPNIKIFKSRRACTANPGRPECGAILGACQKNPEFGCKQLVEKINDLKQKCAANAALPECKSIPVVPKTVAAALSLKAEDLPEGQQPGVDQGTGTGESGQGTGDTGTGDTGTGDTGGGQTQEGGETTPQETTPQQP